jgi:hypothetical protein
LPYASATGVAAMSSQPSMPSLQQMVGVSAPPPSHSGPMPSDEHVWGARTELGSSDVGAKRQGAATAGSWSTQSGQRKRRTSPLLLVVTAGVALAIGIGGVLLAFSHFSGPKPEPDPGKAAVGVSVAATTTTTTDTTHQLTPMQAEPSNTVPTTQVSALPISKTAPTQTVKVRPPTTGAGTGGGTGTGTGTKPPPSATGHPTAPPTNTNAPAHI